jgi:hypothetical protein
MHFAEHLRDAVVAMVISPFLFLAVGTPNFAARVSGAFSDSLYPLPKNVLRIFEAEAPHATGFFEDLKKNWNARKSH